MRTTPDLVQTITHDQPGHRLGNCFAACVAAYFDLPPECAHQEVPQ